MKPVIPSNATAPFWACLALLTLQAIHHSAEARTFKSYKVCHGEKKSVCNLHPEFDRFEGCTNSTDGGRGDAKPEYSCAYVCGVSGTAPGTGICAVVPPKYELDVGDQCRYSWFIVKCEGDRRP